MNHTATNQTDGQPTNTGRSPVPRVGTLLLFAVPLLLTALFLSVWVPGHRQARAVAGIVELGGYVTYEFDDELAPGAHVPPGPQWLWDYLDYNMFYDVIEVRFFGPGPHERATDEALMPLLTNLPAARTISLGKTRVTNDGLHHLQGLTELRALYLGETQLEERDIDSLRGLKLDWLALNRTWAGDEALASLSDMTTLEYLDLNRTRVTDEGLHHLRGLHNLKTLRLMRCRVSRKGAEQLKRELPGCVIHWESLDNPQDSVVVFD